MTRPAGEAARRIYVTDCEGPLTRNDNAQEIAERFLPNGAGFFARLSKYDDFLADVAHKPGYNAGDTLRLIPPFFRAFHVTDEDVELFSAEQVLVVPRALETLDAIRALMPTFIISTSYTPYLGALCALSGFPFENVRCTELSLDAWEMPPDEADWLHSWMPRVCERPLIEYPHEAISAGGGHGGGDRGAAAAGASITAAGPGTPARAAWSSPEDALAWLSSEDQETVRQLDRLFWQELPRRPVSQALVEAVRPVGGGRKLEALEAIVAAEGVDGTGVMYVGDSITDTPPLAAVRAWGGVSLSFNGNTYALRAAEFAAASPDTEVQAQLAAAFAAGGRAAAEATVRAWPKVQKSRPAGVEAEGPKARAGKARARVGLTAEEPEALAAASASARLSVRGERVARLG
jgi:energy-converting hydrogenase A subunit R